MSFLCNCKSRKTCLILASLFTDVGHKATGHACIPDPHTDQPQICTLVPSSELKTSWIWPKQAAYCSSLLRIPKAL